jgi:NAD(P)-dependent dehydrogenase (short-subunit alcohol dehydrogenase family)
MAMDLQLTGKRAVITGGSRGIGLAVATALAAEGTDIALLARDPARLEEAGQRLRPSGRRVLTLAADTTDDAAVRAAVARTVQELGGVDILVNAAAEPAGPGFPRTLAELADDVLLAAIDTKVLGYLRCARAVAPHMIAQGWGRIINISGLAARSAGLPSGSIRNVAVAALTKNLADELGPSGINVTVVHPGYTATERTPGLIADYAAEHDITKTEAAARIASQNSIGHIVTAAEVADVVAFLASPRSIAINGDAIAAGGGVPGAIHY